MEGRTPNKPFKGSFNARAGQTLHQRAGRFAEMHGRKLNAVIVDALQEYLANSARSKLRRQAALTRQTGSRGLFERK